MPPLRVLGTRWPVLLSLVALLLAPLAGSANAQEERASARVRAKIVGQRIVVRCQLSSHATTMPAYLFLSYDRLCGVELHNQATNALEIEKDGRRRPFKVEFPGLKIDVEAREHGDEEYLGDFTKLHASELEEIGVLGTIGANALIDYHIVFDLQRGFLTISDPKEESDQPPEGPEEHYVRAYATSKLVWLPVQIEGEQDRVVGIGGERYDSVVDEILCEELDAPGGAIGPVQVMAKGKGIVDLSSIVPWRPEELPYAHEEGALGILGINFLEDFRVEIDRVNGWVGLTRSRESTFPTEERAFFQARATEEIEPLHEWLKQHEDTRLAGEAADQLLLLHVDGGSSPEQVADAIAWVDRTRPPALRATRALDTMRLLMQARMPESAVVAGRLGIQAGRKDRYPDSVHRLHVRLGEVLLELDRNREAWEHLMSAAFGLNEAVGAADRARVNLLLGAYYERIERWKRAASRYVQAVITPEAGEAAIAGLERVQKKLDEGEFSYELVDRLISGKVRNMVAPTKFEADERTDTHRTALVEHVTNPHLGRKRGENWRAFTEGGAMVFQAIQTHFPRERVVMLAYHNAFPRPVGITNELALRAAQRTRNRPAFLVNGRPVMQGAFDYYEADKGYSELRRIVLRALEGDTPYAIELNAQLQDGKVRGTALVSGPTSDALQVELVLAEKGVLYPGLGATVVHRMVARAALTETLEGEGYEPEPSLGEDGVPAAPRMELPFERGLAEIEASNRKFLDAYEEENKSIATRLSVGMDPQQLVVIAILRHRRTGAVVQTAQVDVATGGN
jgi:hypothetical protein